MMLRRKGLAAPAESAQSIGNVEHAIELMTIDEEDAQFSECESDYLMKVANGDCEQAPAALVALSTASGNSSEPARAEEESLSASWSAPISKSSGSQGGRRGRKRPSKQTTAPSDSEEEGEPQSLAGPAEDAQEAAENRDPCPGCFRIQGRHACFLERSKLVVWLYKDGRGNWCSDCHTNWRVCFAHSHPLSLMKSWLEIPAHYEEWTLHLLATLMLRYEGATKIRLPAVTQRIEAIKLVFRVLNLPLCPFEIVRLSAFLEKPQWAHRRSEITAENLLMINHDGAPELGVWVRGENQYPGTMVQRADMGVHSLRQTLTTARVHDLELLQQLGLQPGLTAPVGQVAPMAIEGIGTDEEFGGCKKMLTKLNYQIDKAKRCLDNFSLVTWPKCASGPLLTSQTKLGQVRDEAKFEGQDRLKIRSEEWLELILTAKLFLAKYRSFEKSRKNIASFLKFAGCVPRFCSVLRSIGNIEAAPSLRLMSHKLMLITQPGGVGQALEKACEAGLIDVFAAQDAVNNDSEISAEYKIKPEVWLEAVLHQAFLYLFEANQIGDTDDSPASAPAGDGQDASSLAAPAEFAEQFRRATRCCNSQMPQDRFLLVRQDVGALHVVLANLLEDDQFSCEDLKKAVAHLKAPRTAIFMEAAAKHTVFSDAIASADSRLLRVAENTLAYQKIAQARAYLADARMPRLSVDEVSGWSKITNVSRITNMSATKALRENMLVIKEALGVLVEMDLTEAREKLEDWADAFFSAVGVVSLVHSTKLIASCKSEPYLLSLHPAPSPEFTSADRSEADAEVQSGPEQSGLALTVPVGGEIALALEESELQACFRELKQLADVDRLVSTSVSVKIKKYLQRGLPLVTTYRSAIVEISHLALRVKPFLETPAAELFLDWQNHSDARQRKSNLGVVLELVTLLGDLECDWKGAQIIKDLLLQDCSKIALVDIDEVVPQMLALPAPEAPEVAEGCYGLSRPNEQCDCSAVAIVDRERPPDSLDAVIERLCNADWALKSARILEACGNLVLNRLVVSLELEGVLIPEISSGVEASDIFQGEQTADEMIKQVIEPTALVVTQAAASKILIQEEDASSWLFPAEGEFKLFNRLVRTLGEEWPFCYRLDMLPPSTETPQVRAYDLGAATNLYTLMNHIAGHLSYISVRYTSSEISYICPRTFEVKLDVKRALANLALGTATVLGAIADIAADADMAKEAEAQFRFPLPAVKLWASSIEKQLLPILRKTVFESYLQTIRLLTDKLEAKPSIDAWINDRIFLADRVKKHLLGWSGRQHYSSAVAQMSKVIGYAKAQHAAFQLQPPLEADAALRKELGDAEEIFRSAKHMVRIIAAASVLLERKPEDRPQEAKKLLEDPKAVFPKALLALLQQERDSQILEGRPLKRSRTAQALKLSAVAGQEDSTKTPENLD